MRKIEELGQQLYAKFQTFRSDEEGATAVEYAVMLAVVLGVTAATFTAVGAEINRIWEAVLNLLKGIKTTAAA